MNQIFQTFKRGKKDLLMIGGLGFILTTSFQNCQSAFTPMNSLNSSSGIEDDNTRGKALYAQNCSSCHGPVENSSKRTRSAQLITTAIATVPQMASLNFLASADIDAIAAALSDQVLPPVTNEQGRDAFACTPGQIAKTPLTKLTNREFRTSLQLILDEFSPTLKNDTQLVSLLANLPSDIVGQDRNTLKEQSLLVTRPGVSAHFDAAYRAAELISTANLNSYPNTNSCLAAATLTQTCHQNFVRELGSRAFRRTLSAADAATLSTSLWDAGLSKEAQLTVTVAGLLSMPDFAYKAYDRGTVVSSQVLQLNAHELAAKISFFITGGPPDSALRTQADSGRLLEPQVLESEVDRLFALPSAQDTIRRLFRESYGYDVYDVFAYPTVFLNGVDPTNLREAMTTELDRYFVDVVLSRRGSFSTLMTSRSSDISSQPLATIYGVSSTGPTELPAERSGFLNRAAMLTKRSGLSPSPIKRGLKVLEHVLCDSVGLPPPSAPTSVPITEGEILLTRTRVHRLTEMAGTSCVACHGKMNSLGYPFERFDSLGRVRAVEPILNPSGQVISQLPIDTNATSNEIRRGVSTTVADSTALADQLGRSDRAMMCFVTHLKRFESRVPATSAANCQMNASLDSLYSNNGNGTVYQAIKALVLSPEFRRWSY